MTRLQLLFSALAAVLLIVLFAFFVFQPQREDLADIRAEIDQQQVQQDQLRTEIAELRQVRDDAPEIEAEVAAAETIVPRDPALPALVRQLQAAADESGVTLTSVSTSRPVELEAPPVEGLSSIDVSVQIDGGYFQIVDFLRRIEQPNISPRGLAWLDASVTRDDASYPELNVALSGRAYAVIAVPLPPEAETQPEASGDEVDDDGDNEAEDAS